MKALWLEDRELAVRDVENPERPGEALVRVSLSGVCGTDIELTRGYYPYAGIIGHEFVGVVESCPEPGWVGRRVVGEINVACGSCEPCALGNRTHCAARTVLGISGRDGCHAQYVSLPVENLLPVPDGVADEAAVFTEPLAAAVEILQQVHVRPTDRVLVVGAGRLGQLIARVLKLSGAGLHVVARHDNQRELLAAAGVEAIAEDGAAPRSYDIVVEATGSFSGFELARSAVRPRGTFVLKSTYHGSVELDLSPLVVDEITVVGSRCGPFAPALRLLEAGLVDPVPLIEATYALESAVEAMEAAQRPRAMKVLIRP